MEKYYSDVHDDELQMGMQEYVRVIFQGRWIILACFVVITALSAAYTFLTDPVYEASATVLVENESSIERAFFDGAFMNSQSTQITNQIEILRSRTLAERVVLNLEDDPARDSLEIFQPNSDGEYLILREQVDWILEHMEVLPRVETDVIQVTFTAKSAFEAAQLCNEVTNTYRWMNKESSLSEFKELRSFLEYQLRNKREELMRSEEDLKQYRETQKLVALDESTRELITHMASSQAELEATMVALEAAQQQKQSVERQLEDRRESLTTDVTQISTPVLIGLQTEYARMVNEKVKYEALIAQDQNITRDVYELQLKGMGSQIQATQQRLQEEAQRIANTSMVSAPLEVAQQLITTRLLIENEIKGFEAKMDALGDVVHDYELQLEKLPEQGLELVRLQRQVEVDQNTFILLTQRLEETKIAEAGQKENIRVIDTAIAPEEPISPKKRLNLLIGAILGIGLGIGLTFLKEFFDDSIKMPDELERMGFPILAIIPHINSEEVRPTTTPQQNGYADQLVTGQNIETRLVTHFDPKAPISEAYRTLRTNIQFQKFQNNESTLLITSSAPKEGKSTTLANLAITMSQMGSKTLLIDTDLRRPVIHSIFNLKKDKGVTNYLTGKLTFDDIVKRSFVDNLYVVTSGPLPPNPSEIIASEAMDNFIAEARENFDVVLFDSPPIIAVTDAAIISTKVDGTILVVRAHQTQKNAVKRAKDLLGNVTANIVGCVLNSVQIEKAYGSYYYYYYYQYNSYYGHDLKRRKTTKVV